MKAIKKPIPVDVTAFDGFRDVKTLEGIAYKVNGATHYILTGPKGEQWPIAIKLFDETYTITDKDEIEEKIAEPTIEEYKQEIEAGNFGCLVAMFDDFYYYEPEDALWEVFQKSSGDITQEVWDYANKFDKATRKIMENEEIKTKFAVQLLELIKKEMENDDEETIR